MSNPSIVYVVVDKMGGILNLNQNLINLQPLSDDRMKQHAVMLSITDDPAARSKGLIGVDSNCRVEFRLRTDNRYSILRKINNVIPHGNGVLVSNDWYELALSHLVDTRRAVIQIVHDEYNLELAKKFGSVVDVFVAHSKHYFDRIKSEVPFSCGRTYHLPYGIPLAKKIRTPRLGRLRLMFLGRMVQLKGIFDLPTIDWLLANAGVSVEWTLVGDGPDKSLLQKEWKPRAPVRFLSPATNAEVLEICSENDIFVFPTRFEGFPVALLEAMSAGLVPVVTDLPSGVPEVVTKQTGYRVPLGDTAGFTSAIIELDRDRAMLESMSRAARDLIVRNFDIRIRAAAYHRLFENWKEIKLPRSIPGPVPAIGSRLDQPWLPNWVVSVIRTVGSRV
jgi:glycosyltransferase involved in cell wall biosynthesis